MVYSVNRGSLQSYSEHQMFIEIMAEGFYTAVLKLPQ